MKVIKREKAAEESRNRHKEKRMHHSPKGSQDWADTRLYQQSVRDHTRAVQNAAKEVLSRNEQENRGVASREGLTSVEMTELQRLRDERGDSEKDSAEQCRALRDAVQKAMKEVEQKVLRTIALVYKPLQDKEHDLESQYPLALQSESWGRECGKSRETRADSRLERPETRT